MDTQLLSAILDSTNTNGQVLWEMLRMFQVEQRGKLKQRNQEEGPNNAINAWKHQNPETSQKCFEAAKHLDAKWKEILEQITSDALDVDNEWDLKEFCDKWGYMIQQLHTLLQVLSQWGTQ